jgi:hypothetical protein
MAIQYSSTIYLAQLDQVETSAGTSPKLRIFSGSAPANCAAADSGTLLVEIALPSDWMQAASGSTKVLSGGPWSATASGGSAATPTHFRIWNTGATTCHVQGTCGIGSGDLSVNGTITSGQTVSVSTFQLNAANT